MNYHYDAYNPFLYNNLNTYMPINDIYSSTQQTEANSIFVYPQNLQNALSLIQEALSGESEDRMFYSWLIENAPSYEDQQIINGIRDNEIGHYELFHELYYDLTSTIPPLNPDEQFIPPENYCAALSRALLGEQNAVQKYRKILYAMQSRIHINVMIEIITDEIRHGILYNYLYAKNGCMG